MSRIRRPTDSAPADERALRMVPTRRWELNVSFAVFTIAAVAGCLGAVLLWHAHVIRENASTLLHRAAEQESEGDWDGAAQSLKRYVAIRPGDASARIRLAKDFDRAAAGSIDKFKSLELFAAAVAAAPDDLEARRRHLALTFESGDHAAAMEHAESLLRTRPDDPTALKYKALVLDTRRELKLETSLLKIREAFEAAHRANPADLTMAARLARLYRVEINEPKAAALGDAVMDELVVADDGNIDALVARHAYRKEFGLAGADADLDRALTIADSRPPGPAPEAGAHRDLGLFLAAGLRAREQDAAVAALEYFERAIAVAPDDARGYLLLGQTHRRQGDPWAALRVLLAGLEQIGPTNLRLQAEAASVEIELGELDDAEKSLAGLERQSARLFGRRQTESLAMIAALRAEILLQRQDYAAAILMLRRVLSLSQGGAAYDRKAAADAESLAKIGTCYAMLGQWDQAAAARQAAADLQPRRQALRLEAAATWDKAGWLDEAVRQYEVALAVEVPPPRAWEALASARFRQQSKLPNSKRDWSAFRQAMARAQAAPSETASLQLLQAEYESASGRSELAAEMFARVESRVLDAPELAVRVAQGYERLGRSEDADRIAERLQKGRTTPLGALLRCELLLHRGRGDEAEQALTSASDRLPAADRRTVQYRLATVLLHRGKLSEARELLEQLAAEAPDDLRPAQALAELALEGGDLDEARRQEQRLRRLEQIEGQTGWRFYRAQRLIGEVRGIDNRRAREALLDEARSLQSHLERVRPYWAPTHLLKARLAQLDSKPNDEAAILAYFTALRLGERRVQVYQELISLLFRQHRIAEAAALIDRLREGDDAPRELVSLAVAADVAQGNLQRAVRLAAAEVAREPDDAINHLRLGQLLALELPVEASARQSQLDEAEAELKRAAELAPADPRSWSALLTFYHAAGKAAGARRILERVRSDDFLDAQDKPFFLAQGYALIGDDADAMQSYQAAVDANPDRIGVLLRAAVFFCRSEPDQAERCLRRALRIEPGERTASRLLAVLLARGGDSEQDMDEVWRLLGGTDASDMPAAVDRRLRAVLLLRRGGSESREQALQTLESLVAEGDEAPVDRLLLARLYEDGAELDKAREQLDALVRREKPDPAHLAAYADHLLRISDQPTADSGQLARLLDQLAEIEPADESFRTLSLRARWLKLQRRESDVVLLVAAFLRQPGSDSDPPHRAQQLLLAAGLYEALDFESEAEDCYRQAAESSPQTFRPLALWLARHDRAGEALELCRRAAQRDRSAAPAATAAGVLAVGSVSADDRRKAETMLVEALGRRSNDGGLLSAVAALRALEGDHEEAVRLLRRTLQLEPRNVVAMNNLAMLLSQQSNRKKEALALVDRAIGIAGAQAELLDTKGWVFLEQQRAREAEAAFGEALAMSPDSPRYRFHLALARQRQGELDDAREMLDRALGQNLADELLSPREQEALQRLESLVRAP